MKPTQNLKKSEKPSLAANGIGFGNHQAVQLKLTHKDLILVAGIIVALIIVFTTWIWGVKPQTETRQLFPTPSVSKAILHKIGNTIISKF